MSNGGDASGRETVRLYGYHLGTNTSQVGVAINDHFEWKTCEGAVRKESINYDPAFGMINTMTPYVECVTARMTVGVKNVTVFVDSLMSLPYKKFDISCKAGFFGAVGELCVSCSNSTATRLGMQCPADGQTNPMAAQGSLVFDFLALKLICHHDSCFWGILSFPVLLRQVTFCCLTLIRPPNVPRRSRLELKTQRGRCVRT